MEAQLQKRHVINVLIPDRSGILRDITTAVTRLGANIDGVSQTVVEGYFTVMLTATFEKACASDEVRERMCRALSSDPAGIYVMPYDNRQKRRAVEGEHYVVTLTGEDHPGILSGVTSFFADRGINIENWNVEFHGARITHIGQITVPFKQDIKQLQLEFRHVGETLNLRVGMQHENIFRAISEVGPIKSLVLGIGSGD